MLKRLLQCVGEYKKESIAAPVYVAAEVALECLLPLVMARLIDGMSGGRAGTLAAYSALMIVMAFASLLTGVRSARMSAVASCGLAKNLRRALFDRVQEFSFADIDRFSSSSLVTRLTTDVTNIQNAWQMILRMAVRTPLMLVFSLVMSLGISPRLSLIFLAILPVLGAALGIIAWNVFPVFERIFKSYDAMNDSVQENISGIRVVKSFVREDYEKKKFAAASDAVCRDFTRTEKVLALNNPVMMFCIYAAMLLLSWFGARMIVLSGGTELTTGQFSSLISYGIQILSSMMMLSIVVVMVAISAASARRVSEVLGYESTLKSPPDGLSAVADGSICFEHVSFRYAAQSGRDALADIDLSIASGETVGILGGTGSSKTTLVQLIPRLYDATGGRVLVGGRDVRDYDLTALRDAVAVVLQKNELFSGTIRENLRWGDGNASDEELERVCRLAQADEFIRQFPDGYDTHIEQGGVNVSGGQKQRLCIARSLLKKPKILILDDSTSAVDTKTDARIRAALRSELPETTKLVIAQRVASVQDADRIVVLDGGRIAEQGTHEELMRLGGIYSELYASQTMGREATA